MNTTACHQAQYCNACRGVILLQPIQKHTVKELTVLTGKTETSRRHSANRLYISSGTADCNLDVGIQTLPLDIAHISGIICLNRSGKLTSSSGDGADCCGKVGMKGGI